MEIVAADLDYVKQVATPVLIDEWQLAPAVWDRVRRAVDEDAVGGFFSRVRLALRRAHGSTRVQVGS